MSTLGHVEKLAYESTKLVGQPSHTTRICHMGQYYFTFLPPCKVYMHLTTKPTN
jgi:hypothetical protein